MSFGDGDLFIPLASTKLLAQNFNLVQPRPDIRVFVLVTDFIHYISYMIVHHREVGAVTSSSA